MKPETPTPVSDTLIETGGSIVVMVVVVVESVNKRVDYTRVAWGCKIPIVRHGAIVMGVVVVIVE